MAQFRKKPVVIDAFQWTGEPVKAWRALDAWLVSLGLPPADEAEHDEDCPLWVNGDDSITIPTLEGDMRCDIGDWIIRGVKGELYPCKPDIFAATYDDV
jgi:hypothetical protein